MNDKIFFDKETNKLTISGNFYNGIWFQYFGEMQHEILKYEKEIIIVDLKDCTFISPTPFLSLLLTLYHSKEEKKCNIQILLGEADSNEKRKFFNYCAREGFLEIINNVSCVQYNISELKSYNVIGNENFEKILSARINDISKSEFSIEETVNALIKEINESNLNVNKDQRLYMVVAVRNILQELIDNVDKHAYDKGSKYFALYIRIRYATDATKHTGKNNNIYFQNGPTTKPDEIYIHKAIEVYFQDIGKGIVKSYEEKGIKYPNRPLREIVNYTFFREKFENRNNNTPINGLAFLRKILQEKNNYFTVYNQFEGTGAFGVSENKIGVNNINMKDGAKNTKYGIIGQIYNFTLFDREYSSKYNQEFFEELIEVYQREYKPIENYVIDLRKTEEVKDSRENTVILFMPSYVTKAAIISKIRFVVQHTPQIRTLIISDVKDEELILFDSTLDGTYISTFQKDIKDVFNLDEIFIITKSFQICFLCRKNSIKKFEKRDKSFKDFNKEYDYLYRLKLYESKELACVLEKHPSGKYILTKGNIKWNEVCSLRGFINFDMLTANDKCFDLLQRNLERILPIVGKKKLYAIDSSVERLVSSVNCIREYEDIEFGVGSVFVSGMTLQSSDYQGNTIHFFSRGQNERKPALFFDPVYLYVNTNDEKEINYVRVGKSSHIRREDYVEPLKNVNSFLDQKDTYKILHQYAYSSVLCGHLNFEKRHDLLSINLNAIMYDENTRLKEYVKGIINYGLGHYLNKEFDSENYFQLLKESCLIVYPYNHFTSSILRECDIEESYSKYIVGLSPTNITSSGEDLEYSECFTDYIADIINDFMQKYPDKEVKIIVFDTLSYSGRTRQEIYEYVSSIEHVEPYFVSIIDAKVNHYPKQANTYSYMNINIPLLGNSETCKMCLSLNKLEAFKEKIIDASILATIETMQQTWKVRDIRNHKEIIKLTNFSRLYAKEILEYNNMKWEEGDDLYFVNALPLYIFITNRIKTENDFFCMEYLMDSYCSIIGLDSMTFILSLFVLEYGNTIYFALLRKVFRFILEYMQSGKEPELNQFAALALLSLEEKATKIILEYIKDNVNSLQIGYEGQIVLMYYLNREKNIQNNLKTLFLYNKMKSESDRLDLYKQFHCQLKNTNGNIHNSPLKKLIEGQESLENKRLTIAALSLLEHSLNCTELFFDMLYEEGRIQPEAENDEEISNIRNKCLKNIGETKDIISSNGDLKTAKTKLQEIFDAGQILHKRLFAPHKIQNNAENRELVSIETLLAKRIDFYNVNKGKDKMEIYFNESYSLPDNVSNNNISTIYYIWNNMLVSEIDYILDNVGKFTNETKAVLVDGKKIAGEVKINITPESFQIFIYNNTDDNIDDIKQKAKQRYQKEVLSLLGVRFSYHDNQKENELFEKNAVVTRIIIPNILNRKEQ